MSVPPGVTCVGVAGTGGVTVLPVAGGSARVAAIFAIRATPQHSLRCEMSFAICRAVIRPYGAARSFA